MKKFFYSTVFSASLLLSSLVQVGAADFKSVSLCPAGAACEGTATTASTIIPNVINLLFVLAAVLSVIFLILGGIKWITAGGDKTKVQAARETIVGAIIGIVIAFGALFFINFVLVLLFGPGQSINTITIPTIFKK